MNGYVLRAAEKEDIPAVLEMERLSFSDPWSEGIIEGCITDGIDFTLLLFGDTPVGYSIVDRRVQGEAELHNIAIKPDHRGKGASKLLMDKMISETDADTVIFLEVRAGNAPAIGLYEKYGFEKIGVRKSYYKNPSEDAIIMQLRVAPAGKRRTEASNRKKSK